MLVISYESSAKHVKHNHESVIKIVADNIQIN